MTGNTHGEDGEPPTRTGSTDEEPPARWGRQRRAPCEDRELLMRTGTTQQGPNKGRGPPATTGSTQLMIPILVLTIRFIVCYWTLICSLSANSTSLLYPLTPTFCH